MAAGTVDQEAVGPFPMADARGAVKYDFRMKYLTAAFSICLLASCADGRPYVQKGVTTQRAVSASATTQPAGRPPESSGHAATGSAAPDSAVKPVVNTALVKQGYRTGLRRGQLVYCRTQQVTGSRFKSEVCLTESQILDEQRRARDTMTAPRQVQCLGPEFHP